MTEPKFCKDCKHFCPAFASLGIWIAASCMHPKNRTKPDLVEGKSRPKASPEDLRKSSGNCGKSGAMFEAKPPPDPPKQVLSSYVMIEQPPEQSGGFWSFLGL